MKKIIKVIYLTGPPQMPISNGNTQCKQMMKHNDSNL